jgi:hypothetical protein
VSGGDRGGGVVQVGGEKVIFTTEARRHGEKQSRVAADLCRGAQIKSEQLANSNWQLAKAKPGI